MALWITIRSIPRHIKGAFLAIIRNGAMSLSTLFAVTITLTLVSVLVISATTITDMTKSVESQLIIYVKLDRFLEEDQTQQIGNDIRRMEAVTDVEYSRPDEELILYAEQIGVDSEALASFSDAFGGAFRVFVSDPYQIPIVSNQIRSIVGISNVLDGGSSTSELVEGFEQVRYAVFVFVIGLVVLAVFFISNTIKLTITARKTEIGIMRLVGASNWYIRIPFMVEGMMLGVVGAIVPVVMTYYGYRYFLVFTGGSLISSTFALRPLMPFVQDVSTLLVLVGAGVGLVGSFLSIRKYLKV